MRKDIWCALYLAVGLCYATLGAAGEFYVATGEKRSAVGDYTGAFFSFVRANAVFPMEPAIREREATIHGVANALPPDMILTEIDRALANDPHNPLLFWYGSIQALRGMDLDRATGYLNRLREIGPDWPETKNAEDVWRAVAKMKAEQDG